MTVFEKKKRLKIMIDKLSDEKLDEALYFVEDLSAKDKSRKQILIKLLKKEKSLFEKLAE